METDFPYLVIPDRLKPIVGEPDPGTRIYRIEGSDAEVGAWYEAICECFPDDSFVSPGGVGMFAGVSRPAVHKRLKQGKLTAFLFHVTRASQSVFGYQKKIKLSPYGYVPVSECKAWGVELKARPDRREAVLEAEGGEKPDWQAEFLDKDPKDKGNKSVKYGEPLTREEAVGLIKCLVEEAIDKALPKGMRRAREQKRADKQWHAMKFAGGKRRANESQQKGGEQTDSGED
jgi:hypothetical protein